jgi:type IV secretion system protein VirB10
MDAGEGISPVTRAHRASMNTKAFLSIGVSVVLLAAVGALVISRGSARHAQDSAQRRVDTQVTTAAAAGAAPLTVATNAAGLPPVTGGIAPVVPAGQREPSLPERGGMDLGLSDVPAFPAYPGSGVGAGGAFAGNRAGGPMLTVPASVDPLDAPVLLSPAPGLLEGGRTAVDPAADDGMAQARAHLEETRGRLEQVLRGVAAGQGAGAPLPAAALGTAGQGIKPTSTARIGAARLVAPALTLPRGTTFSCALASRIVSEQSGPVSCVVARNVYGSDGRVLLVERGSHLDGVYQAQVRVGQSRIAVLWERLRMPDGVVVDLASPGTGALGEAGVGGYVDSHWGERIGAALLLSLVDDAVKIEVAREQSKGNASGTVLLQGSGSETATLAGKVLDSTINIPPTIVKNQGEIVAVNAAQDVDFSAVYELRATPLAAAN